MGEVEGAGYRLEADGAVVHIQRCESGSVGTLICRPLGGRLDGVESLKEGLQSGGKLGSR